MSFRSNIFAQNNNIGPTPTQANTFIGGMASYIPNLATLASKLGILESDISYFAIAGNDIEAQINVTYSLSGTFRIGHGVPNILTSYLDTDQNVIGELGTGTFQGQTNFAEIELKGLESLGNYPFEDNIWKQAIFPNVTSLVGGSVFNKTSPTLIYLPIATTVSAGLNVFGAAKNIYIPNCTSLGESTGYTGCFALSPQGVKIWAHPSLQTSNGGAEDGDLAWARSEIAAEITYSTYADIITPPDAIADATIDTAFATALRLAFTPPASVNAIDFYEVYVSGNLRGTYPAGRQVFATDLPKETLINNITIVAVDVFGNKSAHSNPISGTTTSIANSPYPTDNLAGLYQMENKETMVDVFAGNDGVNYGALQLAQGKIGKQYRYNGTDTYSTISQTFGVTNAASINFWISLKAHLPIGGKTGLMTLNTESPVTRYPWTDGNIYCCLLTNSRKNVGPGIVTDRTKKHMITVTADEVTNVWKMYQNAQLIYTGTVGSIGLLSTLTIGRIVGVEAWLDGDLDELAIYKKAISLSEIEQLWNDENGLTL